MTTIEDRLRDALAARAGTVGDDGRPRVVPSPRRARVAARWWWTPVAVAAATAAVVGVTVLGTRTIGSAPPSPATRPTPYSGRLSPPVGQVWPGAVHEIPATGPGGRVFKPDAFVTDRVLVGRTLTANRLDGIWSYELDKRLFTQVAPLTDLGVANDAVVVGDGYVAWSSYRDGKSEIWAVPVTGGVPRAIATLTAVMSSDNAYSGIKKLAIAGGMAVWSPPDGGVYRVPLKGGNVSLIPGTKGFYLVEWPWAGWPAHDTTVDHPITRPFQQLKDVLTGRSRNAVAQKGRSSWSDCGPTWCFNGTAAWQRDGTHRRDLPGTARGTLLSGRFVLLDQRDPGGGQSLAVHDVATKRTGLLFPVPTRRGDKAPPTLYTHEGVIWYRTGKGTQVVIDLKAAGR
ncbi:hypothetical protein [Nonomuraea sp. NPDC049607]|uniref:hypothetical protein n=1 Tax=Nonomuraea sp. NPDC049607 TaxID=3154732 RepID=UPI003449E061